MRFVIQILRFFSFILITCQPFVFSAQPSSDAKKIDEKNNNQLITCLDIVDLEREIKDILSEYPSRASAIQKIEHYASKNSFSQEYKERFDFYQDSRSARLSKLRGESKKINDNFLIIIPEDVIAVTVNNVIIFLRLLDPQSFSYYAREFNVYNEILLLMLTTLKIQFRNREKSAKALSFTTQQLLVYARICFNQLCASLEEFDKIEGGVTCKYHEVQRCIDADFADAFPPNSLAEEELTDMKKLFKNMSVYDSEEMSREDQREKQKFQELKTLWLRVIKTMEELVKPR